MNLKSSFTGWTIFFGWFNLHGALRRALLKVAYGKAAVGDTENGGGGSGPQAPREVPCE